jgi:enterochelin esterase-like enzyme
MNSLPKVSVHTTLFLIALVLLAGLPAAAQSDDQGKVERIKVFGPSLEGNLEGDSPERDVVVYLPPGYAKETGRRYPVVYFLHGYGVGVDAYLRMLNLQETADKAIASGAQEMILVLPDANTVYSGSMYSNSPTTGDWEGFVSADLVQYIDSHYRTVADRSGRGLSGHSMGGYGTVRIGMKHPEVFTALYAMSSCCLMNDPAAMAKAPAKKPVQGRVPAQKPAAKTGTPGANVFANVPFAQAAAWAPNPENPPQYFDMPTRDGQIQPLVAAKYAANSPLVMVDQYVPNLKKYSAIAMDVGDKDTLKAVNVQLHEELTRLGVQHTFEEYDGDHGNRVTERFEKNVMPFFSKQLKTE